jgi:hypothetical protein
LQVVCGTACVVDVRAFWGGSSPAVVASTGQTSAGMALLRLITVNLFVIPTQLTVYLTCVSLMAGQSIEQVGCVQWWALRHAVAETHRRAVDSCRVTGRRHHPREAVEAGGDSVEGVPAHPSAHDEVHAACAVAPLVQPRQLPLWRVHERLHAGTLRATARM